MVILTTLQQASAILSRPDNTRIPFQFSTDRWTAATATELKQRLGQTQTSREHAVGVVIGSGGLPYILAYAGLSKVYMVDIHAEAILFNMVRIRRLGHHRTWLEYRNAVSDGLTGRDVSRFHEESQRADQSGLMGDYTTTRQNAMSISICGVAGDFRRTAHYIAELAASNDEKVVYVNVTNVADTMNTELLDSGVTVGMLELGKAIGALTLANLETDVTIVDSSGNLVPRIYTKTNYPGVQAGFSW